MDLLADIYRLVVHWKTAYTRQRIQKSEDDDDKMFNWSSCRSIYGWKVWVCHLLDRFMCFLCNKCICTIISTIFKCALYDEFLVRSLCNSMYILYETVLVHDFAVFCNFRRFKIHFILINPVLCQFFFEYLNETS